MTGSSPQPHSWLPKGITEDDVIDLVDGRLPREREQLILAAIKSEPRLGAMVKQFREDRTLFEGVTDHAPLNLGVGIEARLESAAMRDLASAESSIENHIPVSTIEPLEPGILRILLESPWTRRVAMAASLVIVAGLTLFGVNEAVRSGVLSWPTKKQITVVPPPAHVVPLPTPVDPAPMEMVTRPEQPTEAPVAAPALTPPMTLAQAVELAREGRLALTIRAPRAQAALERLETLARAAGREGGWQGFGMDALPAQFAALSTPSIEVPGLKPLPTDPVLVASDVVPHPGTPSTTAGAQPVPVVKAIFAVDLDLRERTLESLLKSVTDGLEDQILCAFREVPALPAADVSLDPERVLWWNASSSNWVRKHTVPIVVETVE